MRTYPVQLGGEQLSVHSFTDHSDVEQFGRFLRSTRVLGVDTETTSKEFYRQGERARLVQFGSDREAWVLDAEAWPGIIRTVLMEGRHQLLLHNAAYDLLVLETFLGIPMEALYPRVVDTYILAHLLDPRRASEGGQGLKLKELAKTLLGDDADQLQKDLHDVFRRELHVKLADGWRAVPAGHPAYVRYAGMDPILTVRVGTILRDRIRTQPALVRLAAFEHDLQLVVARMQRRGLKVDVPYAQRLRTQLLEEAEAAAAQARAYGVQNINAPAQVGAALIAMGERLEGLTDGGQPKVDKGVLFPLADIDHMGDRIGAREPNPLAAAVVTAKRAAKWATTYADGFLNLRDAQDRVHPSIGSLGARTGRMSVSSPPLQQLPSSDWRVRRAIIADPGTRLVSADYAQVELRILAALAREQTMIAAIQAGDDLHGYTARLVYGDDYTPAHRKLMKGVGFGKVYGGGAHTLARQTGAPLAQVQAAVAAYDRVYPKIRGYATHLERLATATNRETGQYLITSPSGRPLPLDRDRLYSATNYVCQSAARDVIADAILRLDRMGFGDHLLLPVHDEIVAYAPTEEADEWAHELAAVMSTDFYGIPLEAEGKVLGPSWGSGYGCPPDQDAKVD